MAAAGCTTQQVLSEPGFGRGDVSVCRVCRSLPVVENADMVPLVQYFDSDSSAQARLSRATSDCIYRARVSDSEDTSIVNLCDSDGGLVSAFRLEIW